MAASTGRSRGGWAVAEPQGCGQGCGRRYLRGGKGPARVGRTTTKRRAANRGRSIAAPVAEWIHMMSAGLPRPWRRMNGHAHLGRVARGRSGPGGMASASLRGAVRGGCGCAVAETRPTISGAMPRRMCTRCGEKPVDIGGILWTNSVEEKPQFDPSMVTLPSTGNCPSSGAAPYFPDSPTYFSQAIVESASVAVMGAAFSVVSIPMPVPSQGPKSTA